MIVTRFMSKSACVADADDARSQLLSPFRMLTDKSFGINSGGEGGLNLKCDLSRRGVGGREEK